MAPNVNTRDTPMPGPADRKTDGRAGVHSRPSVLFEASSSHGIGVSSLAAVLLAFPMILSIGIFLGGPLLALFAEILSDGWSSAVQVYSEILQNGLFQSVFVRTLRIAAIVTLLTTVIAFAMAYALWRAPPSIRAIGLVAVLFPLFTSIVVRTYAWTLVFSRHGLLNSTLDQLGLLERPLRLLGTELVVLIGMVQVMLPFAILPILAGLARIDGDLMNAARVMGARQARIVRDLVVPLTKANIFAGAVLVFVISLGFFITPALLGGPRTSMISNLISTEVTVYLDTRDGAAMSLILLFSTIVLIAILRRFGGVSNALKGRV